MIVFLAGIITGASVHLLNKRLNKKKLLIKKKDLFDELNIIYYELRSHYDDWVKTKNTRDMREFYYNLESIKYMLDDLQKTSKLEKTEYELIEFA